MVVVANQRGPQGPEGPPGPQGPPGPAGSGGDLSYRHQQLTPSTVWNINHGLGKRPSIQAFDSTGSRLEGDENHIDDNTVMITYSAAVGGEAYLN